MASHVIDTHGASLFANIAHTWHGLRERQAARRHARAERNRIARELDSYTDRELFDLGITRANVPEIVAGTFRR